MKADKEYRKVQRVLAKMLHVWGYLVETRDERNKGNKLPPETIAFEAVMAVNERLAKIWKSNS
jgi:hypothetical protein